MSRLATFVKRIRLWPCSLLPSYNPYNLPNKVWEDIYMDFIELFDLKSLNLI